MSNGTTRTLLSMRPSDIVVEHAIVLDWYDGPLSGFLKTGNPQCTWHFKIFASKTAYDLPDDRIYLLSEAPNNTIQRLTDVLGDDERTQGALWIPSWRFNSVEARQRAETVLAEILRQTKPAQILVRTRKLPHLEEVWALTAPAGATPSLGSPAEQQLSGQPGFVNAIRHAMEHGLVDLDPWIMYTSDEEASTKSEGVNRRYPGRTVLCFAKRRDTDDVACVVLRSSTDYAAGQVLIVHDFAKSGSEVDVVFSDFWDWLRAAVEDLIDTYRHRDDPR